MVNERPVRHIKNENMRFVWKIRIKGHSNQSALPVIRHMKHQRRLAQNLSVFPHSQNSSLVSYKDATVWSWRNGGRRVKICGDYFSYESRRNLNA